jgi:hypothetical protein
VLLEAPIYFFSDFISALEKKIAPLRAGNADRINLDRTDLDAVV